MMDEGLQWMSISEWVPQMGTWLVVDLRPKALFVEGSLPFAMHLPLQAGAAAWSPAQCARVQGSLRTRGCALLGDAPDLANVGAQLRALGIPCVCLRDGIDGFASLRDAAIGRQRPWLLLCGLTGAGKTELLQALSRAGEAVLDLERAAQHHGSAFGGLGRAAQPAPFSFANALWLQMQKRPDQPLWAEDEDRQIGVLRIPEPVWRGMQSACVVQVEVPFEARLARTVRHYGQLAPLLLAQGVHKIARRLGPQAAAHALSSLASGDIEAAFALLLRHYDQAYAHRPQHPAWGNRITLKWDGLHPEELVPQLVQIQRHEI